MDPRAGPKISIIIDNKEEIRIRILTRTIRKERKI
jgi:hypothetical protein